MTKSKFTIFFLFLFFIILKESYSFEYSGIDGDYQVKIIDNKTIKVEERPEPLSVRVSAPQKTSPSPLIIFSHGSRCHVDGSNDLTNFWSSHGYTVIQPLHLDGYLESRKKSHSREEISFHRLRDMSLVLDKIKLLLSNEKEILNIIDSSKIIAAGHSYGALVAQVMGGAKIFSQGDSRKKISSLDKRFRTIIAISPPGYMKNFVDSDSAKSISIPMLVTTGTNDIIPPFMPTWNIHTVSFHDAPKGEKFLAVINGADHWFGGLLCRETDNQEQNKEMETLKAITLAFLDYTLDNNKMAMQFLNQLNKQKKGKGIYDFQMK
ncbi:MAG: hypothetical protein CBC47_04125 [Alphaproteobacteria bacterium TMED87]|nr:hypothetical protein [Rhodospirillaceae bacterium]OUV09972.1 MAG: hypothetical protein CBC47_04125 [Alphaproteobacteria bacterium TMED87]